MKEEKHRERNKEERTQERKERDKEEEQFWIRNQSCDLLNFYFPPTHLFVKRKHTSTKRGTTNDTCKT
jgi:hypothetical protein